MMECNKEEAVRAKDIAEMKMKNKEFTVARKIVLKAQRLYNDLENLPQMLTICDVHCAAEMKLLGGEMDWYRILQIQQTADEALIKKQYRKFALQLHPDKNKFPGAEAAFKLIGEAQRVLLDKDKRSLHDHKRKCFSKPAPPYRTAQSTTHGTNVGFQNNSRSSFMGMKQASQQGFPNGRPTFWTICPFCNVGYQYFKEYVNSAMNCQACSKTFIAYERSVQGGPTANNCNQPVFSKKPNVSNQGTTRVNLGTEFSQKKSEIPEFSRKKSEIPEFSRKKSEIPEFSQKKSEIPEFNSQNASNKKRKRQDESSSENSESDSSDDTDEGIFVEKDDEFKAEVSFEQHGENPRRSSRHRQKVSYKENMSDDEDSDIHLRKAKESGSSGIAEVEGEIGNGSSSNVNSHSANGVEEAENKKTDLKAEMNVSGKNSEVDADLASDSNSDSESEPMLYSLPDPEFNDFDKDRRENCYSVDQIWAAYDNLGGMPRFYARIRKVFPTGFRLRITWLEADPDDENEKKWVMEGLPVACGKFRHGETVDTEDSLMFSHLVHSEKVLSSRKGTRRDTYNVLPRKGEIWAIFKNWDIRWESHDNQKFEYEFVQILADYTEGTGTTVGYLGKIRGFVSLFCRIRKDGMEKIHIPRGELFRFSHRVPSFKLTGQEREGVPKGSFELDPASLSEDIEEIALTEDVVLEVDNLEPEDDSSYTIGGHGSSPATDVEGIEISKAKFFNFDEVASIDKFSVGQIWSLYSNDDGLPRYYGKIAKVSSHPPEVQVNWLYPCSLPGNIIQWHDKDMPICCGRFKLKKADGEIYESTEVFSHQLTVIQEPKKTEYTILPKKGEVWAVYRDWSPEIKCSQLKDWKYDVVEVLEETGKGWNVLVLKRENEFKWIFKGRVKGGGEAAIIEVPETELLRFSHQVPAFRLTKENGGSGLQGLWQINPQALPNSHFTTD